MSHTLGDTHLGGTFILKVRQRKGQSGELLIDLGQEIPRVLHLESVIRLDVALEHGGAVRSRRSRPALPGAQCYIHGVHLGLLKGAFVHLLLSRLELVGSGILQCHFLDAIDHESLHLMHAHRGNGVDVVGSCDAVDDFRDGRVLGTGLDGGGGDEHGVVGRYSDVAHFVVDLRGGVGCVGYDEGVGCDGDVTVNVTSKIEFDNVSCFEWFNLLTRQRRIVTNNIIHTNTNGECHSLFNSGAIDLFGV
mmetsp:Transcript_24090/g.51996  ORF Transcript_24090/g.51996 Transcript_24090/m.51996 type:complete len:248 (-) Transcript_24090:398-1141(-)